MPSKAGESGRPVARASLDLALGSCFWALGVDGFCELTFLAKADAELAESGGMSESRKGLAATIGAGEDATDMGLPDAHDAVLGSADDSASLVVRNSERFGG